MKSDTRMKLEGKMDQMRGRLKDAWADLTDDDIANAEGKWDRLIGTIKEKTGQTVDAIQKKLDDMSNRRE